LNNKRTAFVAAVASGADPVAATRDAGYARKNSRRTARRLMNTAAVRAAIAEAGSEKQALLEDLDNAKQMAISTNDAAALVEAIRLRCVLQGLL
jgi:phage terminase small subunit